MNYWLVKSEPEEYSWQDMCKDEETYWDGIKNPQAIGNLKRMMLGNLVFFYHSGKERKIVGLVEVSREFYHHEKLGGLVNFRFYANIKHPISFQAIKAHPSLQSMVARRQPRLSVSPILKEEWDTLINMTQDISQ